MANIHAGDHSARLKPFNWGSEREIRLEDVAAFKEAARYFDHIILVRATNEFSLPFVSRPGFRPKPIDCKPKTASVHSFASTGLHIKCAGLVVDPTLLPHAFTGQKGTAALQCWEKFTAGRSADEKRRKVFTRRNDAGFYAVDTDTMSPYFGCLMLTDMSLPRRDFSLTQQASRNFKAAQLSYIHGDYDLYGLIDVAHVSQVFTETKTRRLAEKHVSDEELFGMKSFHSPIFHDVQTFLNAAIGVPMIQHGSQDTFGHSDEKLYVFTPVGGVFVVDENEESIRAIYRHVFREEPIQQSF
ncbi:hypothetical protein OLMES_3151 [Oleiphilus messinensis]|uniref:Uncharacterized protein n=1 Tax=Oleiphilus messinensis TaxID=141451 RepID=A0A1Y0ICT8_9GAMM|nr:hypothetical protein [Oleiphilus messinensis]ARU57193.1 hypothetical protein OLMES_3151 [Oleiphilus messinensis]